MTVELGWLSLLPPLLAIAVAILTRKVIWALLGGVVLGMVLMHWPDGQLAVTSSVSYLWGVLVDPGNVMLWGFTLAIGALFGVLEQGGTFPSFVQALENKQWVNSKRRARIFTWLLGVAVFIESNVSLMTAGTASRPVYDRLGISREKLAYIIDSTCAPVCILIPLNAWGAFNLGLISQQELANPIVILGASIILNAYAIFALFLAFYVAWTGWSFGPMKKAEQQAQHQAKAAQQKQEGTFSKHTAYSKKALTTVLVTLLTMIGLVPLMLFYTGGGNFTQGKGMLSVFVAIVTALVIAIVGSFWSAKEIEQQTGLSEQAHQRIVRGIRTGVINILPLAIILWLAIALGDVAKTLGTGTYMAGLLESSVPLFLIPALVFILSAITAFAIGSSWGTFALMLPLAIPLALALQLPAPLFIGAALAGGIFGDHASPISDTTIMASLASGTEHIEHVRTQLPYALLAAGLSVIFYLIAGMVVLWL